MTSSLRHGRRGLPLFATWIVLIASPTAADTFYVGGADCRSSGPGTPERPYCTLQQAVNLRGGPGTTLLVRPGAYPERVAITSAQSGTAADPFVIAAETSVLPRMIGLATPAWTWSAVGTAGVHSTPLATAPRVLVLDGTRLTGVFPPLANPALLPPDRYQHSGGTLYVHFGTSGPTGRTVQVASGAVGFEVRQGAQHVRVSGFEIDGANNHGVRIYPTTTGTPPGAVTIENCRIRRCELQGINVTTASDVVLRDNVIEDNGDHGILLQSVTGAVVERNLSARNARMIESPTAAGIRLFTTHDGVVHGNRTTANEDTGIEFIGCSGGLSIQNRSWRNGNHGYDHIAATSGEPTRDITHLGDVANGNAFDGLSIEGGVSGVRIHNCILTDNGAGTNRYDLFVLNGSEVGLQSGHNLLWNTASASNLVFLRNQAFSSLDALRNAHPGLPYEEASLQLDPRFVSPADGDFRVRAGSPAIDAANASLADWPAQDAVGRDRFDDPLTANTGSGPISFADRGALEFLPGAAASDGSCVTAGSALGPTSTLDVSANPLRSNSFVQLTVTAPDRFALDLIDLAGRRVGTIAGDRALDSGSYTFPLPDDVPSGVYFVRVRAGAGPSCRKVVLVL